MPKIHLLLKKEEINLEKIKEDKVAIVFDVLLATSTITTALEYGAKEVIPVMDKDEALEVSKQYEEGSYVLIGEYQGKTLEGFLSPNPYALEEYVKGKTVILSTTNGTVAIKRSAEANEVYVASLLNSKAVAKKVKEFHRDKTIVVVCSGSSGEFNVEDFYGAGYFIDCLTSDPSIDWDLTDAALASHHFYHGTKDKTVEILTASRVGTKLSSYGYDNEIEYVSQHGKIDVVPYLKDKSKVVTDFSKERSTT